MALLWRSPILLLSAGCILRCSCREKNTKFSRVKMSRGRPLNSKCLHLAFYVHSTRKPVLVCAGLLCCDTFFFLSLRCSRWPVLACQCPVNQLLCVSEEKRSLALRVARLTFWMLPSAVGRVAPLLETQLSTLHSSSGTLAAMVVLGNELVLCAR